MSTEASERYETLIDRAHDALDEEDFERGIALAREAMELSPDDFEGYFVAGVAFHEIGDYQRAADHLREAAARSPEDPLVRTYEAKTLFFLGEMDRAEAMLRSAIHADRELPDPCYWLSMIVERRGKYGEADELLATCARLDPECFHIPHRMGRAELEQALEQEIKLLPSPIAAALREVPLVVEDLPADELIAGPERLAPDVLGLFIGASLREASVFDSPSEPNVVYLFQRNLERIAGSREELLHEARVTLIHEIGHYLGLDEDDLTDRGLD
jgi:predicted Zn-dependent protease with MMP-like domain/Flp pilus assembly protein TadD